MAAKGAFFNTMEHFCVPRPRPCVPWWPDEDGHSHATSEEAHTQPHGTVIDRESSEEDKNRKIFSRPGVCMHRPHCTKHISIILCRYALRGIFIIYNIELM